MAAQNGTLTLVGTKTQRSYTVDVYLPDAASTFWTFNPSGPAGSTSNSSWRVPTQEDVILYDFSLATAPTATNVILQADSTNINGAVLRYANQLAALPNRQKLNIKLPAGTLLTAFQGA